MTTKMTTKTLVLDIETSPLLVYIWRCGEQYVGVDQVKEDWSVFSWSAKWLGDKKMMYMDTRNKKDPRDDLDVVKGIWKLLDEADIIITKNGKRFDIKKLNARFQWHKLGKPSSFMHIDVEQTVRKNFAFTSNKLSYLTEKLNKSFKKLDHREFPGMELWLQCLKGNIKAWKSMEKYNKYDVLSLEELYNELRSWDNTVNFGVFYGEPTCSCGGVKFRNKGYHYTNAGRFGRYKCTNCGKEFRDKTNLTSKNGNKTNLVSI